MFWNSFLVFTYCQTFVGSKGRLDFIPTRLGRCIQGIQIRQIIHSIHNTTWTSSNQLVPVYRLSVSQYIMHPFPLLGYINFKWHLNPEPTGPGHSLQYVYRPSPSSIARGYTADMGTILLKRVTTFPISSTSMFYFIVFH